MPASVVICYLSGGGYIGSLIGEQTMKTPHCVEPNDDRADQCLIELAYRFDVCLDDVVIIFEELFRCSTMEWRSVSVRPRKIKSSVRSNASAIH